MNKRKILPYKLIIGLLIVIFIGCTGYNVKASALSDNILDRVADKIASILLADLDNTPVNGLVEDEETLGWSTRDEIHLNNDSGVIYFGKDQDVGVRIASGVLQGKLTTAGSWSAFGASTPGDEGWLAYEPIMVSATNEDGYRYAVIIGGSETATTSITNADGTTVLVADGGFVTTGTADFNAAVEMDTTLVVDGASTLTGNSTVGGTFDVTGNTTVGGTFAVTGNTTLSGTLTQTGVATFTGVPVFNSDVTVQDAIDTIAAGELSLGTSTATSIEIGDTSVDTTINGGLTVDEATTLTGALTMTGAITGAGNWLTTGNLAGANGTLTGSLTVDTDSLYVDNSNNAVGIGTTTPAAGGASLAVNDEIEVYDDTSPFDLLVELKDSATDVDSGIINVYENDTITALISGATGEDTYFDTSVFYLDGSANAIGIGTTSPVNKLVVLDGTNAQLQLSYDEDYSTTFTTGSAGDMVIAANGGDISFSDENLVTTGTLGAATTTISRSLLVSDTSTLSGEVTMLEGTTAITSTTTLTAASHAGHTLYISPSAATTITLPAATDGLFLKFVIAGAFVNDVIIDSAEGDNIEGALNVAGSIVGCEAEDQINFIDTGENLGDFVELRSDGTTWFIGASIASTTAMITCTDPS